MTAALSSRSVRSLLSLPLSSPSASAPLSPSSARRSLAVLFAQWSAVLALVYCAVGRILPWLDWISELGVDAAKAPPSGCAATRPIIAATGVTKQTEMERGASSLPSLPGPFPLLSDCTVLACSQSAVTPPSPSAHMASLRPRPTDLKATRLAAVSAKPSQRSLSQQADQQAYQPQPVSTLLSSRKRLVGFSLPSLLTPPLSRTPSAPHSPRSPSCAASGSNSLIRTVRRYSSRLMASLYAEEEAAVLAARIQLSNVLATVFTVGSLVMFLCMRALVSTSWSSLPLMVATLACPLSLALVPTLNYLTHTTLSRLLLVLLVNFSLFLFFCSTPGHGFSTLFYGCMPLALLLFDVSLTSLPFLLSASIPLLFHLLVTLVVYSSSLYTLNSFISSVILSAVLLHLVSSYQSTHHSLLSASRSSRAAHVAMTSLMHSISHELRTPLNAVCGYSELLLMDDSLPPSQHEMVKTIADNADALTKLVSDFLTFSSSSSGQLRVDAEIMDVEEMLDACVASHALTAHKKGLELVLDVMEDVPALVVGDGQRMREVLSNLISNSIKASSAGCIHIKVGVEPSVQPPAASSPFSSSFTSKAAAAPSGILTLRFDVRDEGVGISAEQQGRLFQPFQSLNPASSTSSLSSSSFGNSRGLGLAICHSLVQLMGGSIGVVSAPERGQAGSLFWFTVQVHMVDMGEDATSPSRPSNGSGDSDSAQLIDAFDRERQDRKHTRFLPVSEGNESEDEDETSSTVLTPPSFSLYSLATPSCLASPTVLSSSLVRHVLLVSPNRTARDVYARIFLQTRGWFVSLCEDEQEARLRLFDSPCQPLRQVTALTGANRATSSPSLLDGVSSFSDIRDSSSPRLFDCVVLDQVACVELSSVQRFALNIQSRLDIPCVIMKMANAVSPAPHHRMVSGRQTDSHNCTPQSSPQSDTSHSRSLLDTTDESQSAGPLSPATLFSCCPSHTSTPLDCCTALPSALFLPRPPSLQKPHYSNVTPPAGHVQQLHSLVTVIVKPIKRKVLVDRVRVIMEQARQRYASRRKRELRDKMQHEHEIQHSQQATAAAVVEAAHHLSSSAPGEGAANDGVTVKLSELVPSPVAHEEHKQQAAAVSHFEISSLPRLPTPSMLTAVLHSCPPEPLTLPSLATPLGLSRDSSSESRPSLSMLRSLDRLTAAARSTSAPAMHAVFMPSRTSSGCNSPIREEKEDCRMSMTQQQHSRGSPFSAASTTSPTSSGDSPAFSASSSSRSSSAASTSDSPSPPRPQPPPHSHPPANFHCSPSSTCCMPASPPTSLSQLRVLVAEDTLTNQKVVARMLQRIGVSHVTIVNDGRECVQAVMGHSSGGVLQQQPHYYHCILMDLLMPVMDGWQATECLRAAGYELPIVALSASAMKSDRVRCDEVGCSAFLSKPTKLADLKDTLEKLVLAQR